MKFTTYLFVILSLSVAYCVPIAGFWSVHHYQYGYVPTVTTENLMPFIEASEIGLPPEANRWQDLLICLAGSAIAASYITLMAKVSENNNVGPITERHIFRTLHMILALGILVGAATTLLSSHHLVTAYILTASLTSLCFSSCVAIAAYQEHISSNEPIRTLYALQVAALRSNLIFIWTATPFGFFIGIMNFTQVMIIACTGLAILALLCVISTNISKILSPTSSEKKSTT